MEAEKLMKKMIGIQKTAFNNTLDIVMALREQSEKITSSWGEKSGILPDQSKKVMLEWNLAIKQSLGEYKKIVNDGFNMMETCFDSSKTFSLIHTYPFTDRVMEKKKPEKKAEPDDEKIIVE